jgi:hypothetical protein
MRAWVIAIRCRARFSWRLSERFRRWRCCLPEEASSGAAPASFATFESLAKRSTPPTSAISLAAVSPAVGHGEQVRCLAADEPPQFALSSVARRESSVQRRTSSRQMRTWSSGSCRARPESRLRRGGPIERAGRGLQRGTASWRCQRRRSSRTSRRPSSVHADSRGDPPRACPRTPSDRKRGPTVFSVAATVPRALWKSTRPPTRVSEGTSAREGAPSFGRAPSV